MAKSIQEVYERIEELASSPFTSPERTGELLYMLRDSIARREGVLSSQFQNYTRGIKKGEPSRGYVPFGNGIGYSRNVESEKFLQKIMRASSKLSSQNNTSSSNNYTPPQYAIVTSQDAAKMRIRDANRRNPIYANGTSRIESANRLFADTNFIYDEVDAPPERAMYLPATKEQADAFRAEDERRDRLTNISKKRHSERLARQAGANRRFDYDMMDEYDQRIHDLTERYGGDKDLAEFAYKKELQKNLPSFFKNSKMSTKDLHKLSSTLKDVKKASPVAARIMRNPTSTIAGIAYAAALWGFGKSDEGNKKVIEWSNARNLYGKASSAFEQAAYMAGEQDTGSISRRLGKHAMKYGGAENAEQVYRMFGEQMAGMSQTEKMYFADAVGFDEKDVAIAEMLAGGLKPSLARRVGANKTRIENEKIAGFASGAGFGATAQSLWLSIPGMSSAQARDMEGWMGFQAQRDASVSSYNETMDSAMADERYNLSGAQEQSTVNNGGDTTTTVNNYVTVNGSDSVETAVNGATKGSLDATRRTRNTDHVATGVSQ